MTSGCGLFVRNGGTLIVGTLVLDPNLSAVVTASRTDGNEQYGSILLRRMSPMRIPMAMACPICRSIWPGPSTNAASFFGISAIAREGNDVRITWTMGSGKTNSLQVATGAGTASRTISRTCLLRPIPLAR